jgi:membrane protease YdiL (CAAX protease family)
MQNTPVSLDVIQLFNSYLALLPLAGLYVLFRMPDRRRVKWKLPVVVGLLTIFASWLEAGGGVEPLPQSLLNGLTVLGILVLAKVRDRMPYPIRPVRESRALQLRAGYLFAVVQIVVSLLFTWIAVHLGATISADVLPKRLDDSPWPWLLPPAIGIAAALYEEIVFRLGADVFLARYLKSTLLTGLVSSLLWSLIHISTDVTPWYLRIIELGLLIGPLSYWFYRRYGLLATILAHALYNMSLVCYAAVQAYGSSYWPVWLWLAAPLLLLVRRR